MWLEHPRYFLIELIDMIFEDFPLFQGHLQQAAIDWAEVGRRSQGIAQLRLRRPERTIRQSRQNLGWDPPSAKACRMRRPLWPSKSETRLDNLMWASSRKDSS